MADETIPLAPAQHVLWGFDGDTGLGLPPGEFITKLLEAAAVADVHNLMKLSSGFPEYIRLVRMWKFESGGSERIREAIRSA